VNEPLDELYLKWLYEQVGNVRLKNPSRTYWKLFRQLYTKEFVWIVPNDDNRLADGLDLRDEFIRRHNRNLNHQDAVWMQLGCSMMELLMGLARHLSFEDGQSCQFWFWRLIENLGLHDCKDDSDFDPSTVDEILDEVIWRTYNPDGSGGLFPLEDPHEDQREVELWYQLNAYLLEHA
jgi:hypothetical protein